MFSLVIAALLEDRYGASIVRVNALYDEPEKGMYVAELRDGRRWVVRRFGPDRPVERVEGDGAVLRHVERHGIPAERVVPTTDGLLVAGSTIVTGYVDGRPPSGDLEELRQLGDILGRIHALAVPSDDPFLTRRAGSLPAEDLASARASLAATTPIHLRAMLDAISDCDDLPVALVHPDAHLGNTVISDEGLVLLDWDGAGQGPRVASLGWALFDAATWHPDGPEAVFDGWSRHLTLTDEEVDHLDDAIAYRPLVHAVRGTTFAARWGDRVRESAVIAARLRGSLLR